MQTIYLAGTNPRSSAPARFAHDHKPWGHLLAWDTSPTMSQGWTQDGGSDMTHDGETGMLQPWGTIM